MEQEFKKTGLQSSPSFGKLMIDSLRKTRQDHPTADMLAGNLPIVGGLQAGMDATDPSASDFQRMLAVGSILPGMKLVKSIVGKLRKPAKAAVKEITFTPEDIFNKPDVVLTPEQRKAALEEANRKQTEIAAQWLKDNPE